MVERDQTGGKHDGTGMAGFQLRRTEIDAFEEAVRVAERERYRALVEAARRASEVKHYRPDGTPHTPAWQYALRAALEALEPN